jgi:hypothetical protein
MLIMLCMEVLNAALRRAEVLLVLSPLPFQGVRFQTSMYANDVVISVAPEARDLSFLLLLLESFGGATGLRTNLDKCSISPNQWFDDHLAVAALHFPCGVKPFPCTYLGLPLSYKRLPRASLQPIIDTICPRHRTRDRGLLHLCWAPRSYQVRDYLHPDLPLHRDGAARMAPAILGEAYPRLFLEGIGEAYPFPSFTKSDRLPYFLTNLAFGKTLASSNLSAKLFRNLTVSSTSTSMELK